MSGELIDTRTDFIEAQARGEVDTQIATAKRFPRSIKAFQGKALSLATLDDDTAASCFYTLPRGGKSIEGPSVRLAEIAASAYGNLRVQASIVSEDKDFIVARGVAWDLEANVAYSTEVRRRITDRNGRRYDADMIGVTANAACSIASRNATLKAIPRALLNPIYEQAKLVAVGKADALADRRDKMVAAFAKMGVPVEKLLTLVGKPSIQDVSSDDVLTLRGTFTAIKDGEASIDETFPDPAKAAEAPKGSKSDELATKLGKKAEEPAPKPGEMFHVEKPAEVPPHYTH